MFYSSEVKELSGSVGPYQVLRHWATSATGEIFAARDERQRASKKVFALIALEERDSNARARDLLKTAVRSSASFSHEKFAKLHDVIEHEGRVFVVSDFVAGETLGTLLKAEGGTFPPMLAICLISELARALADAHSWEDATINAGALLHGDVCPSNIMIGYDGNLALINSGIALNISRARNDRLGLRGHYAYMAPERASCSQYLEPSADIYSLGLVLFEILTGKPAITGSNEAELISAAANPRVPAPSTVAKVTRGLDQLVKTATHHDRTARYRKGEELAEAIAALRSSKRATFDTRLELEKLMQRHFANKGRAMRTLMTRWVTGASAIPRPTSAPRSSSRPHSQSPQHVFVSSGPNAPAPISPFSIELSGDIAATDDIAKMTGSHDLPRQGRRKMSFVQGIGVCLLVFSLLLASTFVWPASWRAVALDVGVRLSYAGGRISDAFSKWIADL